MTEIIKVVPGANNFAENKDNARFLRQTQLLPALERSEDVVLDFTGVEFSTQSFIHALIGEALKQYGEEILDKIEFKNCTNQLQNLIEIVVNYSIGGFTKQQ